MENALTVLFVSFILYLCISTPFIIIAIVKSSNRRRRQNAAAPKPQKPKRPYTGLFAPPERRFGTRGEEAIERLIASTLTSNDRYFANIEVFADGKRAEIDNIIVNSYGVFIIEAKSYKGRLVGTEDDYEWQKYHTTDAGNVYQKTVKNPIPQVKRQIYILHKFLEANGLHVWVRGYVVFLYNNSPIKHKYILAGEKSIRTALHTFEKRTLSPREVERISELFTSVNATSTN